VLPRPLDYAAISAPCCASARSAVMPPCYEFAILRPQALQDIEQCLIAFFTQDDRKWIRLARWHALTF